MHGDRAVIDMGLTGRFVVPATAVTPRRDTGGCDPLVRRPARRRRTQRNLSAPGSLGRERGEEFTTRTIVRSDGAEIG